MENERRVLLRLQEIQSDNKIPIVKFTIKLGFG